MQDYKAAIAKYEADKAAGRIKFEDGSLFATEYPGKAESEAELARYYEARLPYGDVR